MLARRGVTRYSLRPNLASNGPAIVSMSCALPKPAVARMLRTIGKRGDTYDNGVNNFKDAKPYKEFP